jgi:large subunit ribosomal protein L9
LQVILIEDVDGLGKAGDIVSVAEGYARNFLFPKGSAAIATEQMQSRKAEQTEEDKKKQRNDLATLHKQAEQLEGTELVINARVKEGEEIFGSISNKNIATELATKAQLTVSARQVQLDQPITTIGSYDVTVKLADDVETTIKVTIVAEPGSEPKPDDNE